MICRIDSSRLRRALIALALIFGHGAATAAAATSICTLPHGPDGDVVATTPTDQANPPRTGTAADNPADSSAIPHDHGPDAPSVAGASACGATMLATAAPDMAAPPPELPREATGADARIPSGAETPPPFQPPRR